MAELHFQDGLWWAHDHKDIGGWLEQRNEHLSKVWPYIKDWSCAVDAGAFCGAWTVSLAEKFEKVYAFEPSERHYNCLVKNTEHLPNVVAVNKPLMDRACPVHLKVEVIPRLKPVERGHVPNMESVTLDGFNLRPGFIKLDVEGVEPLVLRGAFKTLESHPVILVEEKGHSRAWSKMTSGQILDKLGYKEVLKMKPDHLWLVP